MATMIQRARSMVIGLTNDKRELVTNKNELKEMMMKYFKVLFEKDDLCDMLVAPRYCFP